MILEWWLLMPEPLSPGRKKLDEIFELIADKYVDPVDLDSIIELAIPGLLTNLDPHSVYISADNREEVDGELEGSFSGIGIEFRIENDKIVVAETISGGPGEKVGLLAGDRIIEIDGENVAGIEIDEEGVRTRLRGEKGSSVSLKVERDGVDNPLSFEIVRGDVPMTSIDAAYVIDDNIGYLKINRFSRNTYSEFLQSMAQLMTDGAQDFIIDLRGNVGGYMEPALLMANEFLSRGMNIVSTRGRNPAFDETVTSDGNGGLKGSRVVVVVDELTASASEIFSGAMQDNDRGLVVGRRTFGKGLVQQPIELEDGSEIRLTIQRYYTPSGRSIQKTYKRGQNTEYEEEIFERYRSGEMMSLDSAKINFDLMFNSIGGRQLYGGGGIIPDIFVPNDTVGTNSYYVDVARRGLIRKFANEYVSLNRPQLMKATDVNELIKLLPSNDILLWSFADYAKMNGVAPRWFYINNSAKLIVTQIKALIAYDILGRGAYYKIYNSIDTNVREAVDALKAGKADFPITVNSTE
ncbi:MAG: S41 family peptidase [Muribaculaceae bacterium]|nr:S41 family peptidase [Muribaculaceae bacterium]